jgi:hypothetical protein
MNVLICVYRVLFRCKRRLCPVKGKALKIQIPVTSIPWLWVGADSSNPNIEPVTDIINQHVRNGMTVTPELLSDITGYWPTSWKYVDSKTLEEREFPSRGIVIQYD